jgi:hypothetical protein
MVCTTTATQTGNRRILLHITESVRIRVGVKPKPYRIIRVASLYQLPLSHGRTLADLLFLQDLHHTVRSNGRVPWPARRVARRITIPSFYFAAFGTIFTTRTRHGLRKIGSVGTVTVALHVTIDYTTSRTNRSSSSTRRPFWSILVAISILHPTAPSTNGTCGTVVLQQGEQKHPLPVQPKLVSLLNAPMSVLLSFHALTNRFFFALSPLQRCILQIATAMTFRIRFHFKTVNTKLS